MALKSMMVRNVTYICKECGHTNVRNQAGSTNQTTQSAENHVDESGHTVIAIGTIFYNIAPGTAPDEDPFAAPRAQ